MTERAVNVLTSAPFIVVGLQTRRSTAAADICDKSLDFTTLLSLIQCRMWCVHEGTLPTMRPDGVRQLEARSMLERKLTGSTVISIGAAARSSH